MKKAVVALGVVAFSVAMLAGCKKSQDREVRLKIGKTFEYWIYAWDGSQVLKRTQVSVTFDRAFVTRVLPWDFPQRELEGKKHLVVYARVENMGPREDSPWCQAEVETDNDFVYPVECSMFRRIGRRVSTFSDVRKYWERVPWSSVKQGEDAWWALSSEIREDATPVVLFGELGRIDLAPNSRTVRFRLRLPRDLRPSAFE